MEGKISEHPLAELMREIAAANLSGVLRLSRERAKIAIYFEEGKLLFATSNLRVHRLREVVKRNGLSDAHMAEFQVSAPDNELAAAMLQRRLLSPETLAAIRVNQVGDVLRLALLWVNGGWEFDPRVRLADEIRVQINVNRLLLECARHLPAGFITSRIKSAGGTYLTTKNESSTPLLEVETRMLSGAAESQNASQLAMMSEPAAEAEAYRAIYALSLSGLLQPTSWPVALANDAARVITKAPAITQSKSANSATVEPDELADVQALFARLDLAKDHYEVLDVARLATLDEIKGSYHALARRFHPDRFYQSEAELRNRIESAFARIARAYETLSDQSGRAAYDAKHSSKSAAKAAKPATSAAASNGTKQSVAPADETRAETSFQHGLDALKRNRQDEAMRFLAEAAMLSPREARYRAHYGQALTRQPNLRRIAETELHAALSLEPQNTAYRVMLAELYKQLGLHRRAEGELERALAVEPNHEAARSLLRSLKSKKP